MGLEMRKCCEKCNNKIEEQSLAFICTHECTFCEECTKLMNYVCPNCQGELVKRPRPLSSSVCSLNM
ncbi:MULTISPECIES: DUF1272 domain-containing protein [Bacillus]|uniref:DUF1272 domain-containing protein n=2 Tax=Bacillus pseudomycoides TaxID=64104 RepID=A0A1Y3MK02_9BACI|nr:MULTISPECIES: DUF1272 domain-containing protein [Bacillus cereus group]EOP50301.1 hypothetical protein IIW_02502 [Bacillus cereus VD136]EOP67531.1 hypothetical protein KOW_04178 [Bacillus cereus VDM006]EOQ02976.1 hypothetical protein KOY_00826 [Bacillus cereus VDM021]MDF2082262.1 DUF1272 domain-containing protein [Bacillus pseudomycoides]OUM47493.1 DUF1272 domain-containing protein [Bacillus pseudomycoides]